MSDAANTGEYDSYYYNHCCGPQPYDSRVIRDFFDNIAHRIVQDIRPRTVLDAGCALGFLVGSLRRRGVEASGLDISEYAIDNTDPDGRAFCRIGSVLEPFPAHYDLVVCQEVLEHLQPDEAERAVANLCRHADDVLFSSTPYDFKEATHFNTQPAEYWASLFARHDFYRDVDFDVSFIAPWAARFRRAGGPAPRAVAAYERRLAQLLVENRAQRELNVEQHRELAALERTVHELHAAEAPLRGRVAELERLLAEKEAQFRSATSGRAWRAAQGLRRARLAVVPPGSLRERALRFAWRLVRGRHRPTPAPLPAAEVPLKKTA